jgi:hypothetical protein
MHDFRRANNSTSQSTIKKLITASICPSRAGLFVGSLTKRDRTVKTPNLELPNGVDRADWLTARLELLAKEKDLTRRRDALNAERRRLPMVRIEKDYLFEGPNGKASLLDLFEGRLQLIIYH